MIEISVEKIKDIWFSVAFKKERIVASSFSCEKREDVVAKVIDCLPVGTDFIEVKSKGIALDVLKNMCHIYEGKEVKRKFNLDIDRLPQFTKRALIMTYRIPRGFVATYGGIAKALGNKNAARAVGNAEARNPFAPIVPCHRVVRSNLRLGGYGGGLNVKRAILSREGVKFVGNCVSKENLWNIESIAR